MHHVAIIITDGVNFFFFFITLRYHIIILVYACGSDWWPQKTHRCVYEGSKTVEGFPVRRLEGRQRMRYQTYNIAGIT